MVVKAIRLVETIALVLLDIGVASLIKKVLLYGVTRCTGCLVSVPSLTCSKGLEGIFKVTSLSTLIYLYLEEGKSSLA